MTNIGALSEYYGTIVNIWQNLDKLSRCVSKKQAWDFKTKAMLSLIFLTYCMFYLLNLCYN